MNIASLNGDYYSDIPTIQTNDRGFLLGDGLFETLWVYQGIPMFFEAHWRRLEYSARTLNIPIPYSRNEVYHILQTLIAAQDEHNTGFAIRITLTRGASSRGLTFPHTAHASPTFLASISKLPKQKRIWRWILSPYKRASVSLSASHKTLNYLDNIMARNEALEAGADEAMMFNERGLPTCGAASNFFLKTASNTIATPSLECGALAGITREIVINLAKQSGLEVEERPIQPTELQHQSVLFTNSLVGLIPAFPIQDTALQIDPIWENLKSLYRQYCDEYYQHAQIFTEFD